MFYNYHDLLSYNALYNFIVGNRGAGKTYGAKKHAIKSFLKHGHQTIYLRRYKTELDDFGKFFDDIHEEFPDVDFEVKGKTAYINGEPAIYAIALSTGLIKKSTSYAKVMTIIFDEFVIDSKVIHYLSNEVQAFLEFYETVARMREGVKVLFLSNAVSIVNPYFLYWGIRPTGKQRFTRYGHMLVEFVQNKEFIEAKYKTRFGQIIKGTKYGDYAIENKYLKDNMNFVDKKTGNARFEYSLLYNGQTYGFWSDYKAGLCFISHDVDPFNNLAFTVTDAEHQPNMFLIKNVSKSQLLKRAIMAYENGYMRFEDMRIKNQAIEIFNLLKSR